MTKDSKDQPASDAKLQIQIHPSARSLPVSRFRVLSSSEWDVGNVFVAKIPTGSPFEQCLVPEYWASVAHVLRKGDEIKCLAEDMSWRAVVYVRSVSGPGGNSMNNRAGVDEVEYKEFKPVDRGLMAKSHSVENKGLHLKWCVIQNEGNRILKEGFDTEEQALIWLRGQMAAFSR